MIDNYLDRIITGLNLIQGSRFNVELAKDLLKFTEKETRAALDNDERFERFNRSTYQFRGPASAETALAAVKKEQEKPNEILHSYMVTDGKRYDINSIVKFVCANDVIFLVQFDVNTQILSIVKSSEDDPGVVIIPETENRIRIR